MAGLLFFSPLDPNDIDARIYEPENKIIVCSNVKLILYHTSLLANNNVNSNLLGLYCTSKFSVGNRFRDSGIEIKKWFKDIIATYDHRLRRIGHPVRSAIHKPQIGGLVVGWVTTSEYPLLYVFFFFFFWKP
ncbi:hypothetical protein BGZ60DRAFT_550084 [Tricladium varicosporioides]|nr:hypothetical protein BGZ60DRAFT_550084 [Hymenoscyphus varicosporioides]